MAEAPLIDAENLFRQPGPPHLLGTVLDGKTFNSKKDMNPATEYGKFVFAEKVVRLKADTINFQGFAPLLQRITAVIDDYAVRVAGAKTIK